MKYTHREHKRCAGEPCTSDSYGAAFATMPRKNLLFYCSFEHSPDGGRGLWDHKHWAAWEWRVSGEIKRVEVLIRCEGWSTAKRASSLINQRREGVVAEGEEIWGSYGKAGTYIARSSTHSGRLCRDLAVQHRCRAIASFLQHCTNQWRNNTALLKKASVIEEKGVFPICILNKRRSKSEVLKGNTHYVRRN